MIIRSENGPSFFERVGTDANRPRHNYAPDAPVPATMMETAMQGAMPAGSFAGFKRYGRNGDTYYGITETCDALECGLYRCSSHPGLGPLLLKQRIETDRLLEMPDDAGAGIVSEFKTFWEIGDKFRERGFLHKRGFLLWGPPGSGKTSTLQLLIKKLIENQQGAVLLLENPREAAACLQMARGIEPNRPMIAILEDMDALISKFGENEYLSLLDGEAQVDNIVFLGTTNYPERLDPRFVDRPSRFDTIRYIGMPSAEARKLFLSIKEPSLHGDELETWVAASEGFSVAHLKEMIIAVKCFGQPLKDVVARLAEMHERKPTSEQTPDKPTFGFTGLRGGARLGNGLHA
jgi:hypothetical protein